MKWFWTIFCGAVFVLSIFCGLQFVYARMFPILFEDEVSFASETFGVEKATIFSVINIESHFNKDALSNKGAVGLMQILPSTADEVAKRVGIKKFDLKNPKDNIFLGTAYLSSLIEKFKDKTLALCSYNAGPANVNSWLAKYSSDGVNLDKIPFPETENYIKKFEQNYKFYSKKV